MPKVKKGLSMEEKIAKIESWMIRHPAPFTMKELLAVVPRDTGVIFQSIEECMELLVAEQRVCCEKVGISTLYWRFALTKTQRARAQLMGATTSARSLGHQHWSVEQLEAEQKRQDGRCDGLTAQIGARRALVGVAAEVMVELREMQTLRQRLRECQAEQNRCEALSSTQRPALRAATAVALDAANRWTDNYLLFEEHIVERLGTTSAELRNGLQIPQGLNYVEADEFHARFGRRPTKKAANLSNDGVATTSSTTSHIIVTSTTAPSQPLFVADAAQPQEQITTDEPAALSSNTPEEKPKASTSTKRQRPAGTKAEATTAPPATASTAKRARRR